MAQAPNHMRCMALDANGKQCRKQFVHVVKYHGDSEIYPALGTKPAWVLVRLCSDHWEHKKAAK